MSTFSRGCIRILSHPLQNTSNHFNCSLLSKPSSRFFSCNSILNASKKPSKASKPKKPSSNPNPPSKSVPSSPKSTTTTPKPTALPAKPAPTTTPKPSPPILHKASIPQNFTIPHRTSTTLRENYIKSLASKSNPTLLYVAPSQTLHTIISYTTATFCFGYALNIYNIMIVNPPIPLANWLTYSYTGICFFMVCVGTYLIIGPHRVIRKIVAVGNQTITKSKNFTGMRKKSEDPLRLEIHMKGLLPQFLVGSRTPSFLQPPVIKTPSSAVSISMPLSKLLDPNPTPEQAAAAAAYEAKQKEKYRNSMFTRPFQDFKHWGRTAWKAMSSVLTKEGFVKLGVRDRGTWLMDVSGGWTAQDGKVAVLDRLCEVKEPENKLRKWMLNK